MEGKREAEIVESGGVWVYGRNSYLQFFISVILMVVAHMVTRICVGDGRCYKCCVFAREWAYDLACVVTSSGFFEWIVILWRDTIVQKVHVTFGCLIPWSSLRQNILPSRRRFSSFHPNPNFQNCFSKCVSTPITWSLWSFANPNPKKDFFFLSLIRTSACPCPYSVVGHLSDMGWKFLFHGLIFFMDWRNQVPHNASLY